MNAKRLITLLLAVAMLFCMGVSASAYDITIDSDNTSGHTYEAYQVFAGTLAADGETLSNITWGSGVNGTALLTALQANAAYGADFAACTDADDVAEVLAGYNDNSDAIKAIAKIIAANKTTPSSSGVSPVSVDAAGYYLIVDATTDPATGETISDFMLKVVSDVTITAKDGKTTSQKKVKDTNDTTAETSGWQDSADHDIGDDVPFQLKAVIANDYANYETYKLIFHDTESAGLSFNNDAKVYVDGTEITTGFTVVNDPADGDTFDVVFNDLKKIASVSAGSVITVEYTSELNENAVIGLPGNPNEMHIEYSNNPNNETQTGETPDDKVIVFTFKVVLNKIDGDENPLVGASFELFKKAPADNDDGFTWVSLGEIDGTNLSTFTWEGIDDGDYKLVETATPDKYNSIDDIEFTVSAEHDELSDNPTLTELEGGDLFTGDVDTGALTGDVVNKKGNTLPSTGGIGTTIFYVLGGIMVACAAVLLIAKKRMSTRA